jgi:hypothetical protein
MGRMCDRTAGAGAIARALIAALVLACLAACGTKVKFAAGPQSGVWVNGTGDIKSHGMPQPAQHCC